MYMFFIEGDLKPDKKDEFLNAWSTRILPLLKNQDGFVDEILLLEEGSQQPCGLSFWDSKEYADRYRRDVFPQAKSLVEDMFSSHPKLRGFDVAAAEIFNVLRQKAA